MSILPRVSQETLDAALTYAARGWHIFPVEPRGKRPMRGLRWREASTTDPKTVRAWWKRWPEANIGLDCGKSGLVVLDFDAGKPTFAGDDLLEALFRIPTASAATGGGGYHFLFQQPEGEPLGNSRGRLPAGVDVRGHGGYIVLPPSIHPWGERYAWLDDGEPAPLPDFILELLRSPQEPVERRTAPVRANGKKKHAGVSPYAAKAMGEETAAVALAVEGTRNETLNRAAFNLGQLVAGGELDAAAVKSTLLSAALVAGLPEQEAKNTIASGMAAGARGPRTAPAPRAKLPSGNGRRDAHPAGDGVALEDVLAALGRHEVGDAELLARIFDGRVCYDHSEKAWYFWTDHYWTRDEQNRAHKLVNSVAAEYLRAAAKARETGDKKREDDLLKRAGRLRFKARIKNVLDLATADLGVTGDVWDTHPDKLAVQNGVLDLRTGKLEDGSPSDYIRTVAPVTWEGIDAPAPRWERFLLEIFDNDRELVDFVQRLFGYGVTGHRKEAVLPILWGAGRNGKDTLLSAIENVLGDLAGPISEAVMIDQRNRNAAAATPHLAALRAVRLAWVNETREGAKLDAGQVKQLTGGGRIVARALYAEPVTFTPQHLLMLITNKRPHADADNYALWKRLLLIPFTMSFVDNPTAKNERQRDPDLAEKLKAEAPGVLAWLVRGAVAWRRDGLRPPESVRLATEAYRTDEDTVGQFLEEACIEERNASVKASDLYRAYAAWSESYGMRPMSNTAFGRRISSRYTKEKTRKGIFYMGVGLLT